MSAPFSLHGEMTASRFPGQVSLHLLFYKRFYLWLNDSQFFQENGKNWFRTIVKLHFNSNKTGL